MRTISLLSAATICAVVVAPAMAQHRHHVYRHHDQRQNVNCAQARRESGNSGTVLGAVAGGVLGSQLAGSGSRTTGALLGAGGGALIGHQIGKSNHPC